MRCKLTSKKPLLIIAIFTTVMSITMPSYGEIQLVDIATKIVTGILSTGTNLRNWLNQMTANTSPWQKQRNLARKAVENAKPIELSERNTKLEQFRKMYETPISALKANIEECKIPDNITYKDQYGRTIKLSTNDDQVFKNNVCFASKNEELAAYYYIIKKLVAEKKPTAYKSSKVTTVQEIAYQNDQRRATAQALDNISPLVTQYIEKVNRSFVGYPAAGQTTTTCIADMKNRVVKGDPTEQLQSSVLTMIKDGLDYVLTLPDRSFDTLKGVIAFLNRPLAIIDSFLTKLKSLEQGIANLMNKPSNSKTKT